MMIIYCDYKNLTFKISPRTLKNVEYFESYLKFKKTLKFGLFLQYLLQNLTK